MPELSTKIQQSLAPSIADAGMRLAVDLKDATYLITVTYTPDPVNPDSGRLRIGKAESVRHRSAPPAEVARMRQLQDEQMRTMDRWGSSSP